MVQRRPTPPPPYPPLAGPIMLPSPPPPCGVGGGVVYVGCLTPAHPTVMWCGAVVGCGFQV